MKKYYFKQVMRDTTLHRQRYETNADRRSRSYNSRLGKYMRKNSSISIPQSPKEIWEFEYNRNITKLSFLVLIYLYTQDDDKISGKEKRSIKKFLKKKASYLNQTDYNEITVFTDDLPNITYVMNYINSNEITDKAFNESISITKKIISYDKRYTGILADLKNKYAMN